MYPPTFQSVQCLRLLVALPLFALVEASAIREEWIHEHASPSSSSIPDYFQTEPGPFAGPSKTGSAPFLAQTNVAGFDMPTYVPNTPLQTAMPIAGQPNGSKDGDSIFRHMGNLSPYFPCPSGFGVDEYPLPPGANITQVHILQRHGSRHPAYTSDERNWAEKIMGNSSQFTGNISFLRNWSYDLGSDILTANGRLELFESGVLHYFNYGKLYESTKKKDMKLVARTTTQNRMLDSAQHFLSGFFGLNWADKVDLEVIIEQDGFNNSLSGSKNCPNAHNETLLPGYAAREEWRKRYLANATARFNSWSGNFSWTEDDVVHAQRMCIYETIALGSSVFCQLFTWDEWLGYDYDTDVTYAGNNLFASPTGRAVGVGYVAEFIARIEGHLVDVDPGSTQVNMTLDTDTVTFPTDQSVYIDFSHDTNMVSVLAAFGLRQFAQQLPTTGPPKEQEVIVSHMVPFAARLAIEIITTPGPVKDRRSVSGDSASAYEGITERKEMKYVHLVLNQRTVPLGKSFRECGERDDGWCELETFMKIQKEGIGRADYEHSCFGEFEAPGYGEVTDGVMGRSAMAAVGDESQGQGGEKGQIPLGMNS
ncbi:hypothetical protein AJ79_01358 [Helicocarpus griseus UAMH5409]|uniref:3-phytase n=1 Tax=Helicocarpus griseus UAMH5409 TaxID=1447875 RepID=A0A2B7XYU5_9EURO|nr:hypothetical protein AJ79_01358 [Helicocarpus griseus UAMH5409]